jgi:DNA-binding LacI/PurR family transcriptional regulator
MNSDPSPPSEKIQRAVTLRELAKQVGVSPSTVSRVLNQDPAVRISEKSRSRILALAAATGYRPNRLARSLKLQRTQIIGMLIPDVTNPLFSALFRAVDEFAGAAGYHVILCNVGDSAARFREHVESLSEGHIDGLIVATAHRSDPVFDILRSRPIPYVLVNRRREGTEDAYVVPDDRSGARLAVEYLFGLGHRRIAHIAGSSEVSRTADRVNGYREAVASFGLESLIWQAPAGGLDETAGETGLCEILKASQGKSPTAIFAANDLVALGAMAAARRLRIDIPRDLAMIGCDDVPMSRYAQPALTTIRYPFRDVGRLATEHLIRLIRGEAVARENPAQAVLPVELVIRESAVPPTPA